jgi:hypothetical protein
VSAPTTGQSTHIVGDWMACTSIVDDTGLANQPVFGMPIVNAPNSPFAADTTPVYQGQIVDPYTVGVPAAAISVLTLSIVDTLTLAVILAPTNILNTGRGQVDSSGNLTITFLATPDMDLGTDPGQQQVQRSAVIDWTYATMGSQASSGSGRHQVNFTVQALAGS